MDAASRVELARVLQDPVPQPPSPRWWAMNHRVCGHEAFYVWTDRRLEKGDPVPEARHHLKTDGQVPFEGEQMTCGHCGETISYADVIQAHIAIQILEAPQ